MKKIIAMILVHVCLFTMSFAYAYDAKEGEYFLNPVELHLDMQYMSEDYDYYTIIHFSPLDEEREERLNISDLYPLTNLTELTVDPHITVVDPENLQHFSNLRVLKLPSQKISDISFISALLELEVLDLEDNCIEDITPLKSLTRLKDLDLSANNVESIEVLSDLAQLESLYLEHNVRLTDLTPIHGLNRLEFLSVSYTAVHNIEPIGELRNLIELQMCGLGIADVSVLGYLEKLMWLKLRDNEIHDVSPLCALQKLWHLDLGNNPVDNLEVLSDLPLISLDAIRRISGFID